MEKYMKGIEKVYMRWDSAICLDMARLAGHYPGRCALIGIEPFSMEWGDSLSGGGGSVSTTMDAPVLRLLNRWHKAPLNS